MPHLLVPVHSIHRNKKRNGNTMNLIEKAFDVILLLTGSVAIVAFTL